MSKQRTVRFPVNKRAAPLRRFAKGEQGVTAIEFALVLPVVLLIMLGSFEVPRYVLLYQKISRTSAGVSDLVAQADEPLTGNQMQDIFLAANTMMQPYDVVANGKIIVTSINNPNGGGVALTWQKDNGGKNGGKPAVDSQSRITVAGLANDLKPAANEELLTAEVFFQYAPVFPTLIYNGSQLYSVSYTRPRNHNLMTLPGKADSEP
jgi:Flp pilus assembly protein TadG